MTQLLTNNDRTYILTQLQLAPDSVLADAMLAFNELRDKIVAVRKLTSSPEEAPIEVETTVEPRKNVDPGIANITKIGNSTKQQIFGYLDNGKQPPAKFAEHLKLLWARGEVKFDGQQYYL